MRKDVRMTEEAVVAVRPLPPRSAAAVAVRGPQGSAARQSFDRAPQKHQRAGRRADPEKEEVAALSSSGFFG